MKKKNNILKWVLGLGATVGILGLIYAFTKKSKYIINDLEYKINTSYEGNSVIKVYDDLGKTTFDKYYFLISEIEHKIISYLTFNIVYSPQLKPNEDTFMNKYNPGLGDEVREHENIHIELWLKSFSNLETTFRNKIYKGRIDNILVGILNDNPELYINNTFSDLFLYKKQELINKANGVIVNDSEIENKVNSILMSRHPDKTKFYCNNTISITLQN